MAPQTCPPARPTTSPACSAVSATAIAVLPASAGGISSYDVARSTVDCGGGATAGNVFTVDGTAGQPDAHSVMAGAVFEVQGGFWVSASATCPWDCAAPADGIVSVADFIALLTQWQLVDSSCDFDGSGVSTADFLALLSHWGPCP